MTIRYVTYFRVSTQRQGQSGLGLEAQRRAVSQYASTNGGEMVNSFVEVESGKRSDRPELKKAITACRKADAVLLIAKLDRLARNVHFISGLIESGVTFIATDMPNADRFMLHVYAAMAEEEARRISERTKKALAVAKSNGVELGINGKVLAVRNRENADLQANVLGPMVSDMVSNQRMTFKEVADELNRNGVRTPRNAKWHSTSVHRMHTRYLALNETIR